MSGQVKPKTSYRILEKSKHIKDRLAGYAKWIITMEFCPVCHRKGVMATIRGTEEGVKNYIESSGLCCDACE